MKETKKCGCVWMFGTGVKHTERHEMNERKKKRKKKIKQNYDNK